MTAKSKDSREELFYISKLLVDDLLNTSDAEILEESLKDSSLKNAGTLAKNAFQNAVRIVGAKRLQKAKDDLSRVKAASQSNFFNIDASFAHKIISRLTASNDANVTLAARNLKNISDDDAIELVKELIELGAVSKDTQS